MNFRSCGSFRLHPLKAAVTHELPWMLWANSHPCKFSGWENIIRIKKKNKKLQTFYKLSLLSFHGNESGKTAGSQ